jgi:hypothetical protein
MSDRLLERCAIEFERYVVGLNTARPDHEGVAEAPVPWSRNGVTFTQSEVPGLIRQIREVLEAQAFFAEAAPRWAPLPVATECCALLKARGPMHLLGLYACSLWMLGYYDYRVHPTFQAYGSGVMAHPHCPDHVRDDPQLRAEFPAKMLPGLCNRLMWLPTSTN